MGTKSARIRRLNDEFRKEFSNGLAVMTAGVSALGEEGEPSLQDILGICATPARAESGQTLQA
jgi:hypothetical protein